MLCWLDISVANRNVVEARLARRAKFRFCKPRFTPIKLPLVYALLPKLWLPSKLAVNEYLLAGVRCMTKSTVSVAVLGRASILTSRQLPMELNRLSVFI